MTAGYVLATPTQEEAHMIGFIIGLIIVGLVAGFVARALVPGDDSMSVVQTILLGIVGSFVGGFLGSLIFGGDDGVVIGPAGIIGSIIGAIIVLLVYNATAARRSVRR